MDYFHGVRPATLHELHELDQGVVDDQLNGLRKQLWGRTVQFTSLNSGQSPQETVIDVRFPEPRQLAIETRLQPWDDSSLAGRVVPTDATTLLYEVTLMNGEATDVRTYRGRPPRYVRAQGLVVKVGSVAGVACKLAAWCAPGVPLVPHVIQELRVDFLAGAATGQFLDIVSGLPLQRFPDEATHIRCSTTATPFLTGVAAFYHLHFTPLGAAAVQTLAIGFAYPTGPTGYFPPEGVPLPMGCVGSILALRTFGTAAAESAYFQLLKG